MSTKTLRKRIALATVAALGAGVLSLVSTTAANATATNAGDFNKVTAGTVGLLGSSSNFDTDGATTKTATLLSTGQLVILTNGTTGAYYTVSSGAYIKSAVAAGSDDAGQIGSNQASYTVASSHAGTLTIAPTGAAGSTFTITGYASKGSSVVALATVTIAGSSVAGIADASKSYLSWSGVTTNTSLKADASGASSNTATGNLYLQIDLRDAYSNPVTSAGALTITASTGAVVNVPTTAAASGVSTAGKYSTGVFGLAPAAADGSTGLVATISEATAGAGWSGTVTVAYNGITIGTKSGSISGYISKIVLANHYVSATTGTTADAIRYTAVDAAGNCVTTPAGNLTKNATSNAAVVSSLVSATAEDCTAGAHVSGKITVTPGGTGGKSDVSVSYVRPDGVVVVSNTVTHYVGGAAYSYTAALDKTKYVPGDIAKLTVTFKDSLGNIAQSASAIETQSDNSKPTDLAISLPQLTVAGAYATGGTAGLGNAADHRDFPDANGQVTYTYTVGNVDGTYAGSVGFPTIDSAATVQYSIASGSTSLNDVLKGIVSLIASINKQIAALAKLVTKKK